MNANAAAAIHLITVSGIAATGCVTIRIRGFDFIGPGEPCDGQHQKQRRQKYQKW
jgi:hypothetical protein